MLSTYFDATVVGYYALGNRVLSMPMSLVGMALAQVFFQRASEARREGKLATLVEGAFERLVKLGMFPLLLLTFVGSDLFALVFGARWSEAGYYAQILSVWTFFWFISSPLSLLFTVLERQEFSLAINVAILLTRWASLTVGGALHNVRLGLLLFSVSGVLTYGYLCLSIMRVSGVPLGRIIRILGVNVAIFAPAGICLAILQALGTPGGVRVGVACLLLAAYAWHVLRSDPQLYRLIAPFVPAWGTRRPRPDSGEAPQNHGSEG
jgi:O-antigen/teichoic acid export membrane protein